MKHSNPYVYCSNFYWSNCLIEAVKAKLKDWKHVKIYYCRPRITENGHFQGCHFMWDDGKNSYDFSDCKEETGINPSFYNLFWSNGCIRKFNSGFAREYSRYRNRGKIR